LALYGAHLVRYFLLSLKDIVEGLFVPGLEILFEVFEFLLEPVHLGAMWNCRLPPPSVGVLLKVRVSDPKLL
jgi:hypothetical protein